VVGVEISGAIYVEARACHTLLHDLTDVRTTTVFSDFVGADGCEKFYNFL
jgi:hypothetical protein